MYKFIVASVVVTVLAFTGMVAVLRGNRAVSPAATTTSEQSNVRMENGTQIISIKAKGGYAPRVTTAKANIPTEIRVQTNSTFDCSSALTVAAAGFRENLPPTGETSIALAAQQPGATVQGVCAMGMYAFAVNFE